MSNEINEICSKYDNYDIYNSKKKFMTKYKYVKDIMNKNVKICNNKDFYEKFIIDLQSTADECHNLYGDPNIKIEDPNFLCHILDKRLEYYNRYYKVKYGNDGGKYKKPKKTINRKSKITSRKNRKTKKKIIRSLRKKIT
jgi:hypothetical protein